MSSVPAVLSLLFSLSFCAVAGCSEVEVEVEGEAAETRARAALGSHWRREWRSERTWASWRVGVGAAIVLLRLWVVGCGGMGMCACWRGFVFFL